MSVIVIGAANMDIGAVSDHPLVVRDSNPGTVTVSLGGVGRNIAHNLCLLGVPTALITVLGDDSFAGEIRRNAAAIGLDLSHSATVSHGRTSSYVFVADCDGDMVQAVNDMVIYEAMTPAFLAQRLDFINRGDLVVVDANLPQASIEWLCEHCTVPIIADPVSTVKAVKLQNVLHRLYAIKPNRLEAELLSGVEIRTETDVVTAGDRLLQKGVNSVYLSLGDKGLYAVTKGECVRVVCPKVAAVNATGCGDAMVAALTASILRGGSLRDTARFAMAAGAFAATDSSTIHPHMSVENINILMKKEDI
ncbi:MAG: carbohydrate kinase family protein [Eubacteriales bacterium]|nr:carbohydrate kinase family protein [Eubacteriales bacterium]